MDPREFELSWLDRLYTRLFYMVAERMCKVFGHKVVRDEDASYSNPESAAETFYCTRCGWEQDVIYY
jgi:hypothetical protein